MSDIPITVRAGDRIACLPFVGLPYLTPGRSRWRSRETFAAHGDTIEIVHRLYPIGVAMAGADTFDPYKD